MNAALSNLNLLARAMSAAQIEEAEALARAYRPVRDDK